MNKNTINPEETSKNARGSYALVNGLDMYYEIHGTGEPLVLLHGGFGVIEMFAQLLPTLAETRQIIAVELQGHGHTADIDRPLSYELMADDIAALIKYLGLTQADILGFSLGGGVALQTAIRHPQVVRKLVVISAPCKRDGWFPEVLAGMASINAEALVGTIIHDVYLSTAPKPEDWPALTAKMRQLLGEQVYDWSTSVAEIKAPMLIVVGDADSVRLDHAVEMFGLLGGGKVDGDAGGAPNSHLAVLPSTQHWHMLTHTDLLLPVITPFLDAPMPEVR